MDTAVNGSGLGSFAHCQVNRQPLISGIFFPPNLCQENARNVTIRCINRFIVFNFSTSYWCLFSSFSRRSGSPGRANHTFHNQIQNQNFTFFKTQLSCVGNNQEDKTPRRERVSKNDLGWPLNIQLQVISTHVEEADHRMGHIRRCS